MAKISIVNRDTITRRIGTYLVIGLAGLVACSGVKISRNVLESSKYSSRRESVKELIQDGRLDEAELVLNAFSEGNGLDKPDLDMLGILLTDSKKTNQIKSLDSLIGNGLHDEANETLYRLHEKGILGDNEKSKYETQIYAISETGLLERVSISEGLEKADLIRNFVANFPSSKRSEKLKKEGLEAYLSINEAESSQDVSKRLDGLKEYLGICGEELIESSDFSDFNKSMERHLLGLKEDDKEYQFGDRIKIVNNLSRLKGGNQDSYWFNGDVGEVPIGTGGYIMGFSDYGKSFQCKLDDGNKWYFISKEIEREDYGNRKELQKKMSSINRQISLIKSEGEMENGS